MKKKWSELTTQQLGQIGEYHAKMEFISYGYEIYTPDIDDHGVDFIAKDKAGVFYEVQVKSICRAKYVYIPKDKMSLKEHHLLYFLHFIDGELPSTYIIPSTAWRTPSALLVDKEYGLGKKSKPEWGINYSKKNLRLLEQYISERYFTTK